VVSLAELGGKDDVMIVYGATLDDIKRELEEAQGAPLPEPIQIKSVRKEQ
jgi:hypothetical protein